VYVLVDLDLAAFDLIEAADCQRFHVQVVGAGDAARLDEVLGEAGTVDDDHVWVDVEVVRRLALLCTTEAWDDEFAAMVDYARTRGWLDDGGTRIRAHIEWPDHNL
jgi:hypothetical protein